MEDEIVKRHQIPSTGDLPAGRDQVRVRFDILEYFHDGGLAGEHEGNLFHQEILRKIDKCALSPGDLVYPDGEEGVRQHVGGGDIAVNVRNKILQAVPEEKFVGKYRFLGVKYGLTGNICIHGSSVPF